MIVKLKCIDTCGVKYITKGKIYAAKKLPELRFVYELLNDTNDEICVSTDKNNDIHGKWEIVKQWLN